MDEHTLDRAFLLKQSLFGGLTDEELDLVMGFLDEQWYEPDAVILRQGESNSRVHFIVEGGVAILRCSEEDDQQKRIITELGKGDFFGEMELIDIQVCAATVISTSKTRIVTLSNRDLYMISQVNLRTYTMLVLNLARDISRRLRLADEMLVRASDSPLNQSVFSS